MKLTPMKLLITAIIMVISVTKVAVGANIGDPFAGKSAHSAPYNNRIIKKITTTTMLLWMLMIIVRLILFWLLRSMQQGRKTASRSSDGPML